MRVNKISIYIFAGLSFISLISSIIFTLKFDDKMLTWFQGFSFALLGSSLIALFTAIINYKLEKKKLCGDICTEILHMSNNAQTEFYHPTDNYHMEKLANTVGSCCKSCFDILLLLNTYKEGLFPFSKEKKLIDKFGSYISLDLQVSFLSIGTLLKEEKVKVKQNLKNVYGKLGEILKEEKILEYAHKLLKYNKSKMIIMKVEGNDFLNLFVKAYKKSLLNVDENNEEKNKN